MKEYFGDSAKVYQQTDGKRYLLFPAIERCLPAAKNKDETLLDLACGNGDLFPLVTEKGYSYHGLDISPEMIERANVEYPTGKYTLSSATDFSKKLENKFDVVLISMLFPSFNRLEDITKVLQESKNVLKENGKIIMGVAHPLFDCYMRKGLLGLDYVETKFDGYFTSGQEMFIHKKFSGGELTFHDYHWTFTDYFKAIRESGLNLTGIDECPPTNAPQTFTDEKKQYPTYLVLVCEA